MFPQHIHLNGRSSRLFRHAGTIAPLMVFFHLAGACGGSDGGSGGTTPPPADTVGTLRVITVAQGNGTDPDGFSAMLDGNAIGTLGRWDTIVVSDLTPGAHTIALGGLAPVCTGTGALTRSTTITAGATRNEAFTIDCFTPIANRILLDTQGDLGDLYSLAPNGSVPVLLLAATEPVMYPVASPDGMRFAYHRYDQGELKIAIARPDGKGSHDIVSSCGQQPAWSPDGLSIAYTCVTQGNGDIMIVSTGGGTPFNLTQTPDVNEEHPSWAPDGSRLVYFVSGTGGGLFTMDPDGSAQTQLTFDNADRAPEWAPVGNLIAFVRGLGATRAIYVINANGTGEHPVTGSNSTNYSPTWSPDGSTIAFVRALSNSYDLFMVQSNGTNERRVTFGIIIGDPHWSR